MRCCSSFCLSTSLKNGAYPALFAFTLLYSERADRRMSRLDLPNLVHAFVHMVDETL